MTATPAMDSVLMRILLWLEAHFRISRFDRFKDLASLLEIFKARVASTVGIDPKAIRFDGSTDAWDVVPTFADGREFSPRGYRGPFDPGGNAELLAIRDRAVNAIFDRFGLKYVPREYTGLLRSLPDPIDAFKAFCRDYGLHANHLSEERPAEVENLRTTVGVLMDLRDLKLDDANREIVKGRLQRREYAMAEQLIDVARTVLNLIQDSVDSGAGIIFAAYHQTFLGILIPFKTRPFDLDRDHAASALLKHKEFLIWQVRFEGLIDALDAQLGWLLKYWPTVDNIKDESAIKWGEDHEDIKIGLIAEKEKFEAALKDSPDVDIAAILNELEQLYSELQNFIEDIKNKFKGGPWARPHDSRESTLWLKWAEQCKNLGVVEDATAATMKKVYRQRAMKSHPDRYPGDKAKEAEFKVINFAYHYLSTNPMPSKSAAGSVA